MLLDVLLLGFKQLLLLKLFFEFFFITTASCLLAGQISKRQLSLQMIFIAQSHHTCHVLVLSQNFVDSANSLPTFALLFTDVHIIWTARFSKLDLSTITFRGPLLLAKAILGIASEISCLLGCVRNTRGRYSRTCLALIEVLLTPTAETIHLNYLLFAQLFAPAAKLGSSLC